MNFYGGCVVGIIAFSRWTMAKCLYASINTAGADPSFKMLPTAKGFPHSSAELFQRVFLEKFSRKLLIYPIFRFCSILHT